MVEKPNIDLSSEYENYKIFPPKEQIFRAIDNMDPQKLKVVIIGQDPYHGEGQANGLAFSVNVGIPLPPSLKNIFKEINNEFGYPFMPTHGDLTSWEEQGVLLINAILTVREGQPASHHKLGWEQYTDAVIRDIEATIDTPVVYMLWGNFAQKKEELITNKNRLILKAVHPSPLSASRGFFECGHFLKANEWLKANGVEGINWQIT